MNTDKTRFSTGKRLSRRLATAMFLLAPMAASAAPPQTPLPIEDAMRVLALAGRSPLAISPDGERVAYTPEDDSKRESTADSRHRFYSFATANESKRPMEIRDVLTLREITEQHISPDGRAIAFVVKDADVAANDYNESLYIVSAEGSSDPHLLLQAKSISNVRWTPRGDQITYIAAADKLSQIWSIARDGGAAALSFQHPENISSFEWSPDGSAIAFISMEPVDEKETAAAALKGIPFDDHLHFPFWEFISRSWVRKPTRVWLYRAGDHQFQKLWEQERHLQLRERLHQQASVGSGRRETGCGLQFLR